MQPSRRLCPPCVLAFVDRPAERVLERVEIGPLHERRSRRVTLAIMVDRRRREARQRLQRGAVADDAVIHEAVDHLLLGLKDARVLGDRLVERDDESTLASAEADDVGRFRLELRSGPTQRVRAGRAQASLSSKRRLISSSSA